MELFVTFFILFYFLRDGRLALRTLRSLLPLSNVEIDQVFRSQVCATTSFAGKSVTTVEIHPSLRKDVKKALSLKSLFQRRTGIVSTDNKQSIKMKHLRSSLLTSSNRYGNRPHGIAQYGPLFSLFVAASLFYAHAPSRAASSAEKHWPQWRGPLATGVAPTANPPVTWSEENNIKWKVKISGLGSATPIIWENQVFVQTAIPTGKKIDPPANSEPAAANPPGGGQPGPGPGRRGGGRGGFGGGPPPVEFHQFVTLCLDRQTGKIVWQQVAREEVPHEGHHRDGTFASPSPVTDGEHIIAYFGSRGVYCYDMAGKLKWSEDLGDMKTSNSFGEGSSPALHGNTLVINWDAENGSFIVALDKRTGKTLWKNTREERTSWSTPLIVEHGGKPQIITAATGKVRSYDLATGSLMWECGKLTPNTIPTPVAAEGIVYTMSGFRGNALLAIRLGGSGDLTGTDSVVWSHAKSTPYVPSPLLYGGKIFFFAGNNGVLSCFDAKTGKPLIDAERVQGLSNVYASPIGASGRVYLAGRDGTTVVIKHSDKLEILAANRLSDGFDASPAAVDNQLFLRGREHVYCIAGP